MSSASPSVAITVAHCCVNFEGSVVLDDISCEIRRHEIVSIVGPSGCGKSTLLRVIAGLIEPSNGSVKTGDHACESDTQSSEGLSFVFQDPTLLPWRNVEQNVALPMQLGQSPHVDTGSIRDALDLVGLGESDFSKRPAMLSGGMRMRVSLARALVTRPSILLLDEPFAALDEILRQQLNEELLRIREERGCTMVFVTHNISEAVFLSERILVMAKNPGHIAEEIDVPLAWPRERSIRATPEFAATVARASEIVLAEAG